MIYYVEDDANIRDLTLYTLRQVGFEVKGFPDSEPFYEELRNNTPELVLLDIMLPNEDGLEILKRLRSNADTKHIPVMMLTAKGTEYDKVRGLDAGADDYLAKPFGMMELISRVKALLRRAHEPATGIEDVIHAGDITLDLAAHTVTVDGKPVNLTLKEFDLLKTLMANEGIVLSRAQLLEDVWDISFAGETRTVDVHIQTLRQKIANESPGSEGAIKTVRGVGYSFKRINEG
ncbi:MAG: response regulator transcription factor [Eggerthellaceae bacterium]|nr:response regulator transcription factor [Eggerthellaceae bacterium]